MKEALLVFIGGGCGSVARFAVGRLYKDLQSGFPLATLTANFLACFVFGALIFLGMNRSTLSYPVKLLLITGFCGGFSTYSAFTFETVELFKNGQQGLALINIILNLALSISGLYLGGFAVKALV